LNRIAEAKDRANAKPALPLAPQTDFQLFKARLAVLTSEDKAQLKRTYTAKFNRSQNAENTYGLALLQLEAKRFDKAIEYLDKLKKISPTHPMAELTRAEVLEDLGDFDASLAVLESLYRNYPERYSVVEKLVDLQTRKRRLTIAKKTVTRYLRRISNPNPLAWRKLASLEQRLGEQAASHESLSRYFIGLNEPGHAMSQLKLALQHTTPGSNDELRLEASVNSLRGIPPGANQTIDRN